MKEKTKGILMTLIAAAAFGAAAPVAKYVYMYDITPSFMLALRFSTAAIILWAYIFAGGKKMNYRIDRQQLLVMAIIGGVVYFLTTTFYFNAINFIPVSLHVMIFYSYPFMVNLFSVSVFKEKITKMQTLAMVVAFGGLILTTTIGSIELSALGIMLSALAAVCNGGYILLLGIKMIRGIDSLVTAAYTNTFSAISFFVYCGFKGEINFAIPLGGWMGIGFLAVACTAVAIIALSKGIRLIGSSKASIISTFEPLEGVVLSVIFLGEYMNMNQVTGAVLIILSIIMINLTGEKTAETVAVQDA